VLLIAASVLVAIQHHASPKAGASLRSSVKALAWNTGTAKPRAHPAIPTKVSGLWARPSAEVASRNHRRSGFAWIMRSLGATETQLDRLTGGDALAVVRELRDSARAGDPVAIQVLGQLAFFDCRFRRTGSFEIHQIQEAPALPTADREWFTATLYDDIAFDKQIIAICNQLIDSNEALSWVKAQANQGDAASLWLLAESGSDTVDQRQPLRDAAAAGFAQAQFQLALLIIGGDESAAGPVFNKLELRDLLNQAASEIPDSKAELAVCQYFGECQGIAIDIDAAIANAREAAQEGYTSAILRIGPHLPAGQMDPNEVTAWGLIDASLQQKGCEGTLFTVRAMQNITGRLNAKTITPESRAIAEQLWGDYGPQIMTNLGCES
jgi:hypothetical protein